MIREFRSAMFIDVSQEVLIDGVPTGDLRLVA